MVVQMSPTITPQNVWVATPGWIRATADIAWRLEKSNLVLLLSLEDVAAGRYRCCRFLPALNATAPSSVAVGSRPGVTSCVIAVPPLPVFSSAAFFAVPTPLCVGVRCGGFAEAASSRAARRRHP